MKINALMVALLATVPAFVPHARAAEDLADQAQQTTNTFKQRDPSLDTFFKEAAGYAVFPKVTKGGLGVGAARGKGLVFEKGKAAAVGKVTMTQATVGAQVGGQTFSQLIFFKTPEALQKFKDSKYEMSADVSAVIAADGAAKSAKYTQDVAVFALPESGAMAQAAIGGQKFTYEPLP